MQVDLNWDERPERRDRCALWGHGQTPRTLHPTPYALHPAPCTLYHTPCTMHPTPYTLHPAPCTLHQTPHIPQPPSPNPQPEIKVAPEDLATLNNLAVLHEDCLLDPDGAERMYR